MSEQEITFKYLVKQQIAHGEKFEPTCYETFIIDHHPQSDPETDEALDRVIEVLKGYPIGTWLVVGVFLLESTLTMSRGDKVKFCILSALKFFCQRAFDNHVGKRYIEARNEAQNSNLQDLEDEDIEELFKELNLDN